ncbi:TRAP transporter small permease [Thermodesulfobacteriota bacterium]
MRIINGITRVSGIVSMVFIFLLMILITADVGLRVTLNRPITGTIEIAELLMVVIVFFGLSWTAHNKMHIKVDLFVARYPKRMQKIIDIINYTVALILTAVLCWRTFEEAANVKLFGLVSAYIEVPKYPFYAIAAIGWGCFFIATIGIIIEIIKEDINP